MLFRRRISTYLFLFIPGFALASWVTRTPAIRDSVGASIGEMGLLLFGLSVGSMSGILSSTALVRRFGTKPVITYGLSLMLIGVSLVGLGSGGSAAPLVFGGLVFFGVGLGAAEVAINLEGAEVERLTGAPVLVEIHGFFSLGTLIGALVGIGLTSLEVELMPSLLGVTAISFPTVIWALGGIAPGFGRRGYAPEVNEPADPEIELDRKLESEPVWKDLRLILIAGLLLAFALAEGSATDWLALLMVDGFDLPESSGALVFAGFAAMMSVGRFGGRLLLGRFGRVFVLRWGAALAAIGVAAVIFSGSAVVAGISVMFWGLGVSLGFPLAIAAAGDSGPDSVARVGLVATAGYIAFLVGPPLLGFLGEHFGLRSAMLVVLAVLVVAFAIAPAAGPRSGRSPT